MELLSDATVDKNTYLNNRYGMFVLKDGKIYGENVKRMDLIISKALAVKANTIQVKFSLLLGHTHL